LKPNLPFVSICLLTYNRASELPKTLDSLLAQTHSDFELIINDDRSPDDTEAICREYEKKDTRVNYFKNWNLKEGERISSL
jgi:glycosyltransferase involved in cell wall biosynthesis